MKAIVNGELCEKMVEIPRVIDGVMSVVLDFREDMLRLICWYALQGGSGLEEI